MHTLGEFRAAQGQSEVLEDSAAEGFGAAGSSVGPREASICRKAMNADGVPWLGGGFAQAVGDGAWVFFSRQVLPC